jgi:hypothetical protein
MKGHCRESRRETSYIKQKRRKANWIDHTLRRNCLLKHVSEGQIEGSVEVTGRRGRRRKKVLYASTKRGGTTN